MSTVERTHALRARRSRPARAASEPVLHALVEDTDGEDIIRYDDDYGRGR
jgi:hypothetical protein